MSHMASLFNIISNGAAPPMPAPNAHPRPDWLRVKFFGGERYQNLKRIMRTLDLHTVCESARCPNMGECWEHGTATFMWGPLTRKSLCAWQKLSRPWACDMPWSPA
jgi:lipoic acid synthetase